MGPIDKALILTWADVLSKKAVLYWSKRECVFGVYHLREELIRGGREREGEQIREERQQIRPQTAGRRFK